MYQRKNVEWLYLYYSGEKLEFINYKLGRGRCAVSNRIKYMKLPRRPKGRFSNDVKKRWLKEPHVIALRRLFE